MFKTAYNVKNFVTGEDYKGVVSVTQPEQVLPLNRILSGLKNGTIVLDGKPQFFDITEHEIDVVAGETPEQTNSNIANATVADLAESATSAGEIITAHPGFQVEDAQPIVDAVEEAISLKSNVEDEREQPAAASSQAGDKRSPEALDKSNSASSAE